MEAPAFVKVDLAALKEWTNTFTIGCIILSLFLIQKWLKSLDDQDNMIARSVNGLAQAQGTKILELVKRVEALEEKGNGDTSS